MMADSRTTVPMGYQSGLYDSAFLGILQHCVKLPQFLDAIFSFLARRTDFFTILTDDNPKMGFLPGVSENMVLQAYRKYEILTRKREAEVMKEKETKTLEFLDEKEPEIPKEPEPEPEIHIQDELPITLPDPPPFSVPAIPPPVSSTNKDQRKDAPVLSKKEVDDWEKVSDVYNGAEMDDYKWSQTITDIDVRVPVPEGTTAKNVTVDIRSDHLKVVLHKPSNVILIDKRLLNKVKVDDSMWSVEKDRSLLTINLEKTKEIMWKSVFMGEDGIDLSKVDTTRDISEFDPECQAAIQKVTYDQHLKRLGKPTTSETKAHEMLRKAWNAEGSPFKGTPFDPSKVQISGNW